MKSYASSHVTVRGRFNPAIFQPEWFRAQDLLPREEIQPLEDEPNRMVVTSDITALRFRSVTLEVQSDRWQLSTDRPDWQGDLGDVTSSVFERLAHTPISAVGFNANQHVTIERPSVSVREHLLQWLPLTRLGSIVGSDASAHGIVTANWDGFRVRVQLEASEVLKGGIFVAQNYHRDLSGGTTELRDVLRRWSDVLDRAHSLTEQLRRWENSTS